MAELKQVMRPAEIRKAVSQWVAQGFAVNVLPDGTLQINPAAIPPPPTLDTIDFKK